MHTIAIDWGTTRLRGFLLDAAGAVQARFSRPEGGMQSVQAGGFAAALQEAIGPWLAQHPQAPVIMAGMVGARAGWAEAAYAPTPASARDLAGRMLAVTRADGGTARIIPGVIHESQGRFDVMRGEETLIFGCGCNDGTLVLPGTHSKWARLEGGRIIGFSTYMTGELFALLKDKSILGRLAGEPEEASGFATGLAAAQAEGGLTHLVFSARSNVLAGTLRPQEVGPYLSGLMIGAELAGARALYGTGPVVLVADGLLRTLYLEAFAHFGIEARCITPEEALIAGLARLRQNL